MKKIKILDLVFSNVLIITLAVTIFITQHSTTLSNAINKNNLVNYQNIGINAYDNSKKVNNVITEYINEDDNKQKTIIWTNGINPPKMGINGDFVKEHLSPYITYTAPFRINNGYFDVNKAYDDIDRNLCFSAAASNALHWWLEQNSLYIEKYLEKTGNTPKNEELKKLLNSFYAQDNSEIYKRFVRQFANRENGFYPDLLVDQFINGYVPKENGGTNDPDFEGDSLIQNGPSKLGGYFFDVFSKNVLTKRQSYYNDYAHFGSNIKNALLNGDIILVDYNVGKNNHVVTMWGAEFDVNGQISAVYLTDSDDEKDVSQGMVRYRVVNINGNPVLTTNVNSNSGSKVDYLTIISTGKEMWENYFNPKEKFTINYNKNASDATGVMANQTFVEGDNVTLSKNKFTREGYIFKGWSTSPNGENIFADGEIISNLNNNITLYAVWVKMQSEIIKPPTIYANDIKIFVGDNYNPLDNAYIIDNKGNYTSLTDENIVYNDVVVDRVGAYKVTYRVEDFNSIVVTKSITVTVKEKTVIPEIPEIPETPDKPEKPNNPDINQNEQNISNNIALIVSCSVAGTIVAIIIIVVIVRFIKGKNK